MSTGIEQAMTRHQVQLQRLAGGNYRKVIPVLKQMSKDLRDMISLKLDTESRRTLQIVETQARAIVNSAVSGMAEIVEPELTDLAVYEANFVRSIYNAAVTVEMAGLSIEQINAAVSGSKMLLYDTNGSAQSLTLKQSFKQFDSTIVKDVSRKIIGGIGSGRTTKQIANDIYKLTNTRTHNQAEALVRTATNHVGAVSREKFYNSNKSVIKGERYTATLDSRTTVFCAGYDGNLYPIGEGPQTPYHWNCRSLRIAEVYDKFKIPGLGETRSSVDGPIPASTTYGDFLKRQNKEFQDDVLGPTRAQIFRDGKVKIDQFSDFGRVLTIKELEAKYQ